MGLTIADAYFLKAKGAIGGFCNDWDEATEALNYAISYDENHCPSLCLMGKVLAKYLNNYEQSFAYFDKVIAIDSNFTEVYYPYAKYLIWADELERAKKLIDFAFTVKGIDKASIYCVLAYVFEAKEDYSACKKYLKEGKKYAFIDYYFDYLDEELSRIKKKNKLAKPKKKSKKKKKNSKKKNKKKK